MEEIVVGVAVALHSNPDVSMTVELIAEGMAECVWLDVNLHQQTGTFKLTSLHLYEPIGGLGVVG